MSVTAAQVKELREKTGVGMMECKKALTESDGDLEKAVLYLRERGLSRAAKKAGRTTAEGKVELALNADNTAAVVLELNCETDFVSKNDDFQTFAKELAEVALRHKISDVETLKRATLPSGVGVEAKLTELISTIGENLNLRRVAYLEAPNGTLAGYCHMGGKIGAVVVLDGAKGSEVEELANDLAMHCAASAPKYLNSTQVSADELDQEKELARKKLQEQGKPDDLIDKIMGGQLNKFFKEVCFIDQVFVKDSKYSVEKLVKEKGKGAQLTDYRRFQLGEGIEKKQEDFAAEVAAAVKPS